MSVNMYEGINSTHDTNTPLDPSTLYIPERRFWVPNMAEAYLDDDGTPKRTIDGNEDYERRPMPLIDTDNYPLVDRVAFANDLRSLFRHNYRPPQTYIKTEKNGDKKVIRFSDNVDHLQQQHLYRSSLFNGDIRPHLFCNRPDRKIILPALKHNVRNYFYKDEPRVEEELREAHMLAMTLCTDALRSATLAVRAQTSVKNRFKSVRKKYLRPVDPNDTYGKGIVFGERAKRYDDHKRALGRLSLVPEITPYTHFAEELADAKPIETIYALSQVATLDACWDMRGYIRHRDDSVLSTDPNENHLLRRTLMNRGRRVA